MNYHLDLPPTPYASATQTCLSLAGRWKCRLGGPEPEFPQGALPTVDCDERIELPATTETADLGPLNAARETWNLTRARKFEGAVWYEREVEIPAAWAGKRVELFLERTKYSQVWLDGAPMGERAIFGSPQTRELGVLAPGTHRITVMVDNRDARWPAKGWDAHQNSDATQTNWNGIVGKIELRARDAVSLASVRVSPDVGDGLFLIKALVRNETSEAVSGALIVSARSCNHSGAAHVPPAVRVAFTASGAGGDVAARKTGAVGEVSANELGASSETAVDAVLLLGEGARLWDEADPCLYAVSVTVETPLGTATTVVETGLREFSGKTGQFTINGRTTFLRGKHDACVFPLTGHPPMDEAAWLDYLGTLKAWGINHLRCHTWLPPEAAYRAADRLGIYVQPELPFWGILDDGIRAGLAPEGFAHLDAYANHPSFVMLSLGNELQGPRELMRAMIEAFRAHDDRVLYADGSNTIHWNAQEQPHNDWRATATVPIGISGPRVGDIDGPNADKQDRARQVQARGTFGGQFSGQGIVQTGDGATANDYSEALIGAKQPLVAHETGQFGVFPDLREIPRYTGPVQARNFELCRDTLIERGMIDQAYAFCMASGRLAADLYKEDQERYLRTRGFGGFQVLDLQDFPGQGTALVGMLNAFMENKGFTTARRWRRACDAVTVLARFERVVWTRSHNLVVDLELAHYGPTDWRDAVTEWRLVDASGDTRASGVFRHDRLAQGGVHALGRVTVPLAGFTSAERLELRVEVVSGAGGRADGTPSPDRAENDWAFWVFPDSIAQPPADGVLVAKGWDASVASRLAAGGTVALIRADRGWADTIGGGYANDYWSWQFFHNQPGTLGLLIDEGHPALAGFPTLGHSERQWDAIARAARPAHLGSLPAGYRPIVQVIDNAVRCERLGLVYELNVGPGRLLACSADLDALAAAGHPEAACLRASLLAYAASSAFAPAVTVTAEEAADLFTPSLAIGAVATASSFEAGHEPALALSGDEELGWLAAAKDAGVSGPAAKPASAPNAQVTDGALDARGTGDWFAVDLGAERDLRGMVVLWDQEKPGWRYVVDGRGAAAGEGWRILADQGENGFADGRHRFALDARAVRHLRVRVIACPDGCRAGIRELRLLGR